MTPLAHFERSNLALRRFRRRAGFDLGLGRYRRTLSAIASRVGVNDMHRILREIKLRWFAWQYNSYNQSIAFSINMKLAIPILPHDHILLYYTRHKLKMIITFNKDLPP